MRCHDPSGLPLQLKDTKAVWRLACMPERAGVNIITSIRLVQHFCLVPYGRQTSDTLSSPENNTSESREARLPGLAADLPSLMIRSKLNCIIVNYGAEVIVLTMLALAA